MKVQRRRRHPFADEAGGDPEKFRSSFRCWCYLTIATLLCFLSACIPAQASDIPYTLRQDSKTLIVGVRVADKPFSYRTAKRINSRVLPGFGGYMIEICRKVLEEIVSDGYFEGYRVLAKEVDAGSRFSLLDTGQVDILCGPDSITQGRLAHYTTSHPVFLSGVVLVSRPAEEFPRSTYCQGVVGMVRGTTAESSGLEQLLALDEIRRFKPALMSFLAQYGGPSSGFYRSSFVSSLEKWIASHGKSGVSKVRFGNGQSPIESSKVRTGECREGYGNGPVIFYNSHRQGVEGFCSGDTLFYLGDVDLLKSAFESLPACDKVFQRTTLTREAYGIYFRKVADHSEAGFSRNDILDAVLYAQFNNILLRKMQDSERILEYEYEQEFGNQTQGEDLMQFFKSFQYANNY